ncbi:MAG TPA: chloride channel protein [Elusimicrobiota bacterium]|jgi:CIC family chloride channel protein|nr:chloride channel protein [Elusimicrobiota bacterium]
MSEPVSEHDYHLSAAGQALLRLARAQPFDRRLLLTGVSVGLAAGAAAYGLEVVLGWFAEMRARLGEAGPLIGPLFVVALPALGGLLSGWLTRRHFPEAAGGVEEVAHAISDRDGHIPVYVVWVKTLASAATIGLGGSAGLEGPAVQIGSSAGSALGRFFDFPARDLKTFVAAGAVGGLSAAFGIPMAGVFFTMEVILRDFANEAFPAVVVASVTGAVVARMLLHGKAVVPIVAFDWTKNSDLALYAGLGLLCAFIGRGYIAAIHRVKDEFDRWNRFPDWTRPCAGGFLVGALTLGSPRIGGTGEGTSQALVSGTAFGWHSISLVLGKIAATALTLGSGGSGGSLTPSLFIGAAAGSGWGQAAAFFHLTDASPGAFAVVGLCGVFTAAFSAPITGMMIGVEMTREYGLLMPVMVCCAIAYIGSRGQVSHTA